MLNNKQTIALWIGVAAVVILGLYPPWTNDHPARGKKFIGYSAIFSPAAKEFPGYGGQYHTTANSIDVTILLVEWVIIAVITGGLIVTLSINDKGKD